ncbi:hypothetical protein M1615_02115 [Patescibacteria group bacterium]|nr:hypothetical protein [Patescibacteria group bacterium]
MAEIISFGNYQRRLNIFQSFWLDIKGLSTFTKLVIATIIILTLALNYASEKIQTYISHAAPTVEVSTALPPNCHLAVDFSACGKKSVCKETPFAVCGKNPK